ncbi:MAG: hypothetical protein JNL97_00390, partial [Verrucomicrobiales bacterium]|nr:hypothetical protein [Verrucomicrobiales bacterium]
MNPLPALLLGHASRLASRASRLLARSIPVTTLACGLAMAAPAADPSAPIPITPQFLTRLVDEARTNHPGLRAAAARVVASE